MNKSLFFNALYLVPYLLTMILMAFFSIFEIPVLSISKILFSNPVNPVTPVENLKSNIPKKINITNNKGISLDNLLG